MISRQASCLLHYGLYQFRESIFKNGRITPYTVRLPQFPTKELFYSLAKATWMLDQFSWLQKINCIGIANSGTKLAEAIHQYGLKLGKQTCCSIVDPHATKQTITIYEKGTTPIIIDNAVTTGKTVFKALNIVRQYGYRPKIILRIFDREDIGEDGLNTTERIKINCGLNLISIFRLRDIIPCLNQMERQAVLKYQFTHGTLSFKKWIGDQNVF